MNENIIKGYEELQKKSGENLEDGYQKQLDFWRDQISKGEEVPVQILLQLGHEERRLAYEKQQEEEGKSKKIDFKEGDEKDGQEDNGDQPNAETLRNQIQELQRQLQEIEGQDGGEE